MPTKPRVAIVGPGRLGTALALQLSRVAYTISELVHHGRRPKRQTLLLARTVGAQVSSTADAQLNASVIWFCVPDREIAPAARALANRGNWKGKAAFHSSGALTSRELDVLRQRGAAIASVHPLMTFVAGTVPSLQGVPFALEGDPKALQIARKIARDLGAEPFKVEPKNKVAYHAWGAFTSPLLIALLINAEQVARAAGISAADARRKMLPILKQTIENYGRFGPAGAFSGPLVRGDAEVVRKHLQVLKKIPATRYAYIGLASTALERLPVQNKIRIKRLLHLPKPRTKAR
ncbi:MAG TPA: DUF2520 domain-containing protein [Terriglobales bacterium]|nr:DUF2520 domain-containing protein [Terriglobales bacterium]